MLQISTSSTIEILLVIQQGLPLGEPPIKTLLSPYLSRISVAEVSSHVKFEKKKKRQNSTSNPKFFRVDAEDTKCIHISRWN